MESKKTRYRVQENVAQNAYSRRAWEQLVNTKAGVRDNTQVGALIEKAKKAGKIGSIIGDGAYDANNNYIMAKEHGIEFIAPPHRNAAEHINMYHYQIYDQAKWAERNAVIRRCEEKGIEGWKKEVGYHRRSIVENSFYRLKRIFGNNLKSRNEESQYTEQCIRASLINRFNKLGLPKYAV